ncbi:MAG: tetratricopeptide repeat protein [Bryobacteraceae bacterium]
MAKPNEQPCAIIASMNCRVLAALIGLILTLRALAAAAVTSADAREHAEKGVQCAGAGDLVCAETELRRAVALAPNDASYLTSLGGVLGMQQKLDQANLYFERAVQSDPENAAARRNLAANQWRLGQLKQAQANLERLLRVQPQDKTAMLLLGMVSENERDYTRAVKLLAGVPELVEQRPESVGALASSYYHTGRREDAHKMLEALLGRPATPEGIFAAAGVAAQAEDYGLAEKLFASIRSSYPDTTTLAYNLALVQFRTQRIAESRKTLLGLVSTGHATAEVYTLLGRCYEKGNDLEGAVRAFRNAIRLEPAKESNYRELLAVLINRNRLAAARETARKTVEAFPQSQAAYIAKGRVEMKTGEFTDAVRSYSRAVELDAKSVDAKVGVASAKWGAGMRADAEAEFQTLLKHYPREAAVYEGYGTSLLSGASDDAMLTRAAALLKKSVQLDSARAEAHYQLGILELKKNTAAVSPEALRQALEELQAALRLGLNESKVHYALVRVYRRLGRENDASREMHLYEELKTAEDHANQVQKLGAMQGE